MDSLYVGQTEARISLETGVDAALLTSGDIQYRKPDWTVGTWTGTLSGTTVYYDVTGAGDIDQPGLWTFWAVLTYLDGDVAYGEPYTIRAYRPGYGRCC